MPTITLLPGQERELATPGLYFSITGATGKFTITGEGVGELNGQLGRSWDIPNIRQLILKNSSANSIEVEYENGNVRGDGSAAGLVSIANAITVKRIEESINVDAKAVVKDGEVNLIQPDALIPIPLKTIQPKTAERITPANNKLSRKVTIQVLSQEYTELYIGANSTIDATKGSFVAGKKGAPGSAVIKNTSEIWVYNDSNTPAVIATTEEYKQ